LITLAVEKNVSTSDFLANMFAVRKQNKFHKHKDMNLKVIKTFENNKDHSVLLLLL